MARYEGKKSSSVDEEPVAPKREKLTAADMEEKWSRSSTKLRERRKNTPWGKIVRVVAIGGMAIATGVLAVNTVSAQGEHDASMAAQQTRLEELQLQASTLNQAEQTVPTKEQATETIAMSEVAGAEIARLQNVYRDLDANTSLKGKYANYDSTKVASDMGSHLTEAAQDAKVQWFTGKPVLDNQVGTSYAWTFEPSYNFTGKTVNVVWLAKDPDGTIVAWSTAAYNADSKKFSNFMWGHTTAGAELMVSEQQGGSPEDIADQQAVAEAERPSPVVPVPQSSTSAPPSEQQGGAPEDIDAQQRAAIAEARRSEEAAQPTTNDEG